MLSQEVPTLDELYEGKVFLFDKPYGWTSFDVVNKVRNVIRRAYGVRKFKVGHAGTLDPLATGLLVICAGRATKRISSLQGQSKTYTGTFKLGSTTPSFDLETEVDNTYSTEGISLEEIRSAAKQLTGEQLQMPPKFSAKKVAGKRAYKDARKGRDVAMRTQLVWVHRFDITEVQLPEVNFHIHCSKGTYIRALARDMGEKLNCGAHLTSLRRISSGELSLENAFSVQEFESWIGTHSA